MDSGTRAIDAEMLSVIAHIATNKDLLRILFGLNFLAYFSIHRYSPQRSCLLLPQISPFIGAIIGRVLKDHVIWSLPGPTWGRWSSASETDLRKVTQQVISTAVSEAPAPDPRRRALSKMFHSVSTMLFASHTWCVRVSLAGLVIINNVK